MEFFLNYGKSLDVFIMFVGVAVEILIMIGIYLIYKIIKDKNKT